MLIESGLVSKVRRKRSSLSRIAWSAALRAVMSVNIPNAPENRPAESRIGTAETRVQTGVPSRCRMRRS